MRLFVISSLVVLAAAWICFDTDPMPEAETLAAEYFSSRATGDLDWTLSLYGDKFFQEVPRSDWSETLTMVDQTLGRPAGHTLYQWNTHWGVYLTGAGYYVTLEYEVDYLNHPAREKLTIYRPFFFGRSRIIGHFVNSPAFANL